MSTAPSANLPPSAAPRVNWRAELGVAALLAVTVAIVYAPELLGQRAFYYFDIHGRHLPARQWGFARVAEGTFPQWCPDWGTGFPFVAESETGIVYPPNYLFYPWLAAWRACNYAYLLHLWIAGWGMYRFCRLGAGIGASVLAATMYQLGGRLLIHQICPTFVEVFAWFPFVLCGLERFATNGRPRWLGLAAIAGGLQLLAGSLHAALCCQVGYTAYLAGHLLQSPGNARRLLAGYGLWLILTVAIGAAQLVPTAELYPQSARAVRVDVEYAENDSMPPALWTLAVVPYLFGHCGYACAWLEGSTPWVEIGLYHGVLAIPLAVAGLTARQSRRLPLVLMGGVGVILASGEFHFLGDGLQLPVLSRLRTPARFLILPGLSLCALAAVGWDRVRGIVTGESFDDASDHAGRHGRWAFWISLVGMLTATALVGLRAYGGFDWPDPVDGTAGAIGGFTQRLRQLWWENAGWTILSLLGGGVAVAVGGKWPRTMMALIWLVTVADLGWQARMQYPTTSPDYYAPPALVTDTALVPTPTRLWGTSLQSNYKHLGYRYPLMNEAWRRPTDYLYGEQGLPYGVAVAPHYLPLKLYREVEFQSVMAQSPYLHGWVGSDGLMSPIPLDPPPLGTGPPIPVGKHCWIYPAEPRFERKPGETIGGVSQVFFLSAGQARLVPPGQALREMVRGNIDPHAQVLLEGELPAEGMQWEPPRFVPLRGERRGPNRLEIAVDAPSAGFVVLCQTWYPGWRAWVDGRPTQILRANHLFQALFVPAGAKQVALEFASRTVWWGIVVSVLGLIAAILLATRSSAWPLIPATPATGLWIAGTIVLVVASLVISAVLLWPRWSQAAFPRLSAHWDPGWETVE